MNKLHLKPTSRKDKKSDVGSVLGTIDNWKFEQIKNLSLSLHSIAGSVERIEESKEDRLIIVLQGFATNRRTREVIRDGSVIELPAGVPLEVQGQMKYYVVSTK